MKKFGLWKIGQKLFCGKLNRITFFGAHQSLSNGGSSQVPGRLYSKHCGGRMYHKLVGSGGGQNEWTTHYFSCLGICISFAGTMYLFLDTVTCGDVGSHSCMENSLALLSGFPADDKRNKTRPNIAQAIEKTREMLLRCMQEHGVPAVAVGVSVNGKNVYAAGFGYADVENKVQCTARTVMPIASISKPITMVAAAQLWEQGKLDLDAPIQAYLPKFPKKTVNGEKVSISTRNLLSHKSGVRHYSVKSHKSEVTENDAKELPDPSSEASVQSKKAKSDTSSNNTGDKNVKVTGGFSDKETRSQMLRKKRKEIRRLAREKRKKEKKKDEFDAKEYYIRSHFKSIEEAMTLFEEDELFFKPGEGFLYTTHGWTVVSAVIEAAAGKPFDKVMTDLFRSMGLSSTRFDEDEPIIYNRARYYIRDKKGRLKNAPYVNNSYKWAGGGLLSTVLDLTKFGNAMLYSYQSDDPKHTKGYLKADTMKMIWTPVDGTDMGWDRDGGYGLGWGVVEHKEDVPFCRRNHHYISHTGGAVGASCVLLILPTPDSSWDSADQPPQGTVVSIICNMRGVGLNKVALGIAQLFSEAHISEKRNAFVHHL